MKKYIMFITVICLSFLSSNNGYAKVTGECGHCHTMHNSQNGLSEIAGGPTGSLTKGTCVGCHTGENTYSSTTPYVFTPGYVSYGDNTLAGGNFYWVLEDDRMGHNVSGIPGMTADANLSAAPGDFGMGPGCGGGTGCHATLFNPTAPFSGTPLATGCEGCHLEPKHHAPQQAENSPALAVNGFYRFLSGHMSGSGVIGIEDEDWEFSNDVTDHNEYYGEHSGSKVNTMTAYCVGCHGNFHTQKDGDSWVRHPSDAILPNEGEYTAYTSYDPMVPVARPALDGIKTTVTAGQDMVMCLSCHRAHGSPYPDILRWNYTQMEADSGAPGGNLGYGCLKCHSEK